MNITQNYWQRLSVLVLLTVVCMAGLPGGMGHAQTEQPPLTATFIAQNRPQAAYTIYLPMTISSSPASTPPPDPTPDPKGEHFVERDKKTSDQGIVIDTKGGTHLAYTAAASDSENYVLTYAFCPAPADACSDPTRWQRVTLPVEQVDLVQLALTRAGQPRIVARSYAPDYRSRIFSYGECDNGCLSPNNWSFAAIAMEQPDAETEYYSYLLPNHFFALDGQDRPRFVFANRYSFTTDDRRYTQGGYYAQCDADCTGQQNWVIEHFTHTSQSEYGFDYPDSIVYPSLAFTSQDTPRIVAYMSYSYTNEEPAGIYYFGCDEGCESDTQWARTMIAERGNGPHPTWRLALDNNDRPQVAFYAEPDVTTLDTHRLYYLTCADDCERGGVWNNLDLGLPAGAGDGVDLALDTQGRPRMAYTDAENNLGYAWCNNNCENAASWQQRTVETRPQLEAEFPVAILPSCDGGFWDTLAAMLALDNVGNPHVAYRGIFQERCYQNDPSNPYDPPTFSFKEIWHSIRLAHFSQT